MAALAMNLSLKRVDYRYLKVLIVGEAIVGKVMERMPARRLSAAWIASAHGDSLHDGLSAPVLGPFLFANCL
jgi:hypothetical protein